jgi:hypothetical protein
MADQGHEDEHRGEQNGGRDSQQGFEHGLDQSGMLGDADAEECHDDNAEWWEVGEGFDHSREEAHEC